MPQVTVYIREEDMNLWRGISKKSEFIHSALNGLSSNGRTADFDSANLGSSPSEPAKTYPPVTGTLKGSPAPTPYSPPIIQNLADADPGDGWKQYDPKRPYWSPFGDKPVYQNPMNPLAACDPNLDENQWIPFDVTERNAWLERE